MTDKPRNYDALLAFAQEILSAWPDGCLDGGYLQDIAADHGLLVPETRYAPCAEECYCSGYSTESDFADGVVCYRLAGWLKGEKE